VAQSVDAKTMSLQYLETLRALGQGQATKIVIPMEFTSMLQPLLSLVSPAGAESAATPKPDSRPTYTPATAPPVQNGPALVSPLQPLTPPPPPSAGADEA